MKKSYFKMDERNLDVFRKICTFMYILTIYALIGIQLYRQFILHQPHEQWDDIAIVLTVNVLVCIGAYLFLTGSSNLNKIKLRYILIGYSGFVLVGLLFTIFKYAVLLGQDVGFKQIADYFFIVLKISGLFVLGWGLLAFLGRRRIDKQIE